MWATAPYFHNGAVPTLYDVLHSAERPSVWKATEDRDYDFVKIGLKLESTSQSLFDTTDANAKRRIFDTSQIGKSKEGHTFPEKLSEEQKDQVLEYLKTL